MHFFNPDSTRRRGAAALFTIIIIAVLLGFASLTIDVGALYSTRVDLQNAADASAMAAASALISDSMVQVRSGKGTSDDLQAVISSVASKAQDICQRHRSFGGGALQVEAAGITTGWIDMMSGTSSINGAAAAADYNAVQVLLERSDDSLNGPLNFFFAPIFGIHTADVSASAVAVFDDRVSEYDVTAPGAPHVWPFTILETEFDNWVAAGQDDFAYNAGVGTVAAGTDGLFEVRLYPGNADGGYGLLNIGTPNHGTSALRDQILNGVSAGDLQTETGVTELTFVDGNGDPTTYSINGNGGSRSTLEGELQQRIGDIVTVFLHEGVDGSGEYQVTQLRFGRIMAVELHGAPSGRSIWFQPITYTGPAVTTHAGARSTNGAAGRIVLAR